MRHWHRRDGCRRGHGCGVCANDCWSACRCRRQSRSSCRSTSCRSSCRSTSCRSTRPWQRHRPVPRLRVRQKQMLRQRVLRLRVHLRQVRQERRRSQPAAWQPLLQPCQPRSEPSCDADDASSASLQQLQQLQLAPHRCRLSAGPAASQPLPQPCQPRSEPSCDADDASSASLLRAARRCLQLRRRTSRRLQLQQRQLQSRSWSWLDGCGAWALRLPGSRPAGFRGTTRRCSARRIL